MGGFGTSQGCPNVSPPLVLKARAVLLLPIPHFSQAQRGISSSPGLNPAAFSTIIFTYSSTFYSIPITASKTVERGICSREFTSTVWFFFIGITDAGCSSSSSCCSPCCRGQCQENPKPWQGPEAQLDVGNAGFESLHPHGDSPKAAHCSALGCSGAGEALSMDVSSSASTSC